MESKKIVVLCGGDSPERAVSLESGRAVASGLRECGHRVGEVDLASAGDIFTLLGEARPDLFFLALHGGWGENGRIQSVLEMAGAAYTGSGPSGCAVSMDKFISKKVFAAAGLEVPWGVEVRRGEDVGLEGHLSQWGALVVKPCCGGSTVATSVVSDPAGFRPALEAAWAQEERSLVEAYIPGRELTVAVLERNGRPLALPAVEIIPEGGFYDYRAKYGGGSRYVAPADLDPDLAEMLGNDAAAAHRSAGCSVYSRVDFRLDADGRPWILEINTAPGMTAHSLVPKAGRAGGLSFPELLNRIVEESLAAKRAE